MSADEYSHAPVLLAEVLDGLAIRRNGTYVDCTYGRGGHSAAILRRLDAQGRLLVMDRDPAAVADAELRFGDDARVVVVHAPFSTLRAQIERRGWRQAVDGILLDLGVSSPQLDEGARGFSFARDGDLDMRFDPGSGQSAADWINHAPQAEIADVLKRFGEERHARRIAAALVSARQKHAITRTQELRELVAAAVPGRERGRHPATRTFQALRIFINRELEELEQTLPQAVEVLRPGGRLVVISFHSLEDRIVKRFMRKQSAGPDLPRELPVMPEKYIPLLRVVARAIRASGAEVDANPRARSAVLRAAERCAA
jgi:16S rRNA (cytosine1402-N4)-methyltransferase